jgi:hypothetical protein
MQRAFENVGPRTQRAIADAMQAITPKAQRAVADAMQAITPKAQRAVADAMQAITPKKPVWEYTSATMASSESWEDVLRTQGQAGWEAWHMERHSDGSREVYFKKQK